MFALDFRLATSRDVPLLATLNRQLQIDEAHPRRMELSDLGPRMSRWLEDEGYKAILFESADSVAGYALYRRDDDHFYLKQFFVSQPFRRRGVGRQAIEWLTENVWCDAPAVYLDVLSTNVPGIAFWRAVGFGDYCITMERKLVASQ
jgi:predicted acetyltransferase